MPLMLMLAMMAAEPVDCPPVGSAARDRLKLAGEVCKDDPKPSPTPKQRISAPFTVRELPEAKRAQIRRAAELEMLDGAAARFIWPTQRDANVYCGFVNGKNAFGAYTGYKPYYVSLSDVSLGLTIISDRETGVFQELVTKWCKDAGYSLTPSESSAPSH